MLESSDWSFRLIQMGVSGGGEMWSLEVVEALCGPLEEKAKVALLTDVASLFFLVFLCIPEQPRIGDLTAVGVSFVSLHVFSVSSQVQVAHS
jgi:hypothetical protein